METEKWGSTASKQDALHRSRRDVVRDDIAKRLRNVCGHLSDQEFATLVETMVDQKLRGERRRTL
jgi:hypothetical protein